MCGLYHHLYHKVNERILTQCSVQQISVVSKLNYKTFTADTKSVIRLLLKVQYVCRIDWYPVVKLNT